MSVSYVLTPPTVDETPLAWDRFLVRVSMARGITILENGDGTFYTKRYPSLDELLGVSRYWMGGHKHDIDANTAAALTAAGFGQYITTITL